MSGLEGICTKCGLHYYGWALNNPLAQKCGKCGSALEIKRDYVHVAYSPHTCNNVAPTETSNIKIKL